MKKHSPRPTQALAPVPAQSLTPTGDVLQRGREEPSATFSEAVKKIEAEYLLKISLHFAQSPQIT